MKLDKSIVQRRLDLMAEEGVVSLVPSVFKWRLTLLACRYLCQMQMLG
jgi:hypothetical protein